jgi:phosphomethylpyrimidine synthase
MTSDDMFNAVRKHAKDGVDFVTVHAGVNLSSLEWIKKGERITEVSAVVVRSLLHGCCIIRKITLLHGNYDYYARKYPMSTDMAVSLGDGMRPGCIHEHRWRNVH